MGAHNKSFLGISQSQPFWFKRYGRTYHLKIENAEALAQVLELDEAHWVATNAPIETINTDSVFLDLFDVDKDGRIRTAEVKQGIRWLFDHLQDTSGVRPGNTTLDIAAIRVDAPQGKRIHRSAMKIFIRKRSSAPPGVTLEEVRRIKKKEEEGGIDKPGLVLPTAAPDDQLREFLEDIIATVGGEPHPGGASGVTRECLEQFLQEIRTYHDWLIQADLPEDQSSSPVMPFGRETPAFYTLFSRLREKIDQYFALCNVMYISPAIADHVRQRELQRNELDFSNAHAVTMFLAEAPLAQPAASDVLDFETTINPHYAEDLDQFRTKVLSLILGSTPKDLSSKQWGSVKERFISYQNWFDSKPEVKVESLSSDKLRRYLDNAHNIAAVHRLIQESYKTAFVLDNIRLVEKLILYQAYMIPFVNSFVSFPQLYDPNDRALFEMGTLIMDGRHFTLGVRVPDREQHIKFSDASNIFVLYVEISAHEGEPLYEIAVPVTSGMRGNLQVNKRGIFKDIHGRDLHAEVVRIVENPISFFEAISAPFQRLGRAITIKLDEISSKAEEKLEVMSTKAMTTVGAELKKQEAKVPAKRTTQTTGGLLAGGGIAIAALSSSIAFITKTLSDLSWITVLGGLFAAAMAVMLPTAFVAYLKLAKRDLSAILEGSGWGINARMKLTHKQALTFTLKPPYPSHSKGIIIRRRYWWILVILAVAVVIGWYLLSLLR